VTPTNRETRSEVSEIAMDESHQVSGFADVDRSAHPERLVDYLNVVSALDQAQTYKRRAFALLDLHEGDHVLDVGCGTGDDLRALAPLVGPSGRVVGLDRSAQMIATARQRCDDLQRTIRLRLGDAQRLPFPDGSFDACRADRVLQHLDDPARALAEMVRVARPNARVVISEPDWGTLVLDAPNPPVTRRLLQVHDQRIPQPWIGRRLPALFRNAGLGNVQVIGQTAVFERFAVADVVLRLRETAQQACAEGIVSTDDAAQWLAGLDSADQAQCFFAACTIFTIRGFKEGVGR